ncbi:hypothetical protein RB195_026478 [Necator americanus]|uniref:Secreted protein n=1 Tax=Necator americanus TaxID=51031 RepID=A0ABR1EX41_NECAM
MYFLFLLVFVAVSSSQIETSRKCGWDTTGLPEEESGTHQNRSPQQSAEIIEWRRGQGVIDDPRIRAH